MNLIYFLGRFHVLALHLPIGILVMAVFFEIVSRRARFRDLQPVVNWVWAAGALSAVVTASLGLMHAAEEGFDGIAIAEHRAAGLSLALLATAICVARLSLRAIYARIWPWTAALMLGLLVVAGHLGGNLTHGSGYLLEFAPVSLQRLAGLGGKAGARHKELNDVAEADLYADVVAPSLQQRCSTCHNASKHGGGLSMASYETLMKGGEQGAVITPGDSPGSEIVHRINLPPSDKDFMPKEGKTPLSGAQALVLAWWISQGAPKSALVATLMPTPAMQAALRAVLGSGATPPAAADRAASTTPATTANSMAQLPEVAPADPSAVGALEGSGFVVRQLIKDSNLLVVDFVASRMISDEDIRTLGRIAPQVRELNLRGAQLTDARLQFLAGAQNLARLRLEDNPITDVGLSALTSLQQLAYLNLVDTRVTDAGLGHLASLSRLKRVYTWGTAVTPAALINYQ